jgi:hypothetical protein
MLLAYFSTKCWEDPKSRKEPPSMFDMAE